MRLVALLTGLGHLYAAPLWAEEAGRQGAEEALNEAKLHNYEDFTELSIQDLLGTGGRLRFSLDAFGDLGALGTSADGGDAAFVLGTPSLLIVADLDGSVRALIEPAIEVEEGLVDPERMQIGWYPDARLAIVAGRVHSPLGYWNTAYHHGAWLHLPIERPHILQFEDDGGLLPVHAVGVFARVRVPLAGLALVVDGGLANGRGLVPDDIRMVDDANDAKSVIATIALQDVVIRGLRLGAGVVYDRIPAAPAELRPALPDHGMRELIGNVHVVFVDDEVTAIVDAYALRHRASGRDWSFAHAYVLFGRRFGVLTPYVLDEVFARDEEPSPFYADEIASFEEVVAGLRWDVSRWSALKAEYHLNLSLADDGRDPIHVGMLNWSFGI